MFRKILRMGMHSPMAMAMLVVGLFVFQGITLHLEVDSESYRRTRKVKNTTPSQTGGLNVSAPAPVNLGLPAFQEQAAASGPEIAPTAGCPIDPLSPSDHLAYEEERGPEKRVGFLQRLRDR